MVFAHHYEQFKALPKSSTTMAANPSHRDHFARALTLLSVELTGSVPAHHQQRVLKTLTGKCSNTSERWHRATRLLKSA
jgi:hypothetical protein